MSGTNSDNEEETNDMSNSTEEGLVDVTLERGIVTDNNEDVVIGGIEVDDSLINMFLEFTGTTDTEIARNYISSAHGDIERAAELFLTGMPPEPLMVQPTLTAATGDSMAHNISSELEMLMRSAGGNETGINRLQELTSRFLRMSGNGGTGGRNSRKTEVFPEDESLYLKFDSPKRIKDKVKKLKNPKKWSRIYELGNLAVYSKETCEEILENNVVEEILVESLEKSDSKEAERTIIRSLQVFEALSMSVFCSFYESREHCGRWFISPRRNAASKTPSMTFLNGLITISTSNNGSSSARSQLTKIFLEKVLPTSDVAKLEHMWLSNKFDPHWRDKKTECELLSLSLYRGCSIRFLSRLVNLVRGCRACVNPELERVGSLEKPIVLAARADFVTEDTDISSDYYPQEPSNCYSLEEKREIWSHRACEILLDHGAKVSVILKNQEGITDSARKLIELELAAKRRSARVQYLKALKPVSEAVKQNFAEKLVPMFFQRALFTLRSGTHGLSVKRRILDVLASIVAMLNKKQESIVLKQLLYDSGVFKELMLIFLEVFQNDTAPEELKSLTAHLAMSFLVSQDNILPTFKLNLQSKQLITTGTEEFKDYLLTKLFRFGLYGLLKQSNKTNVALLRMRDILEQNQSKDPVRKEASRVLTIARSIGEGDTVGLKQLSEILTEDPFSWSKQAEYGITPFEFEQAELCEILQVYLQNANEKHVESFFQFFQPPLKEIVDEAEELETKEAENIVQRQEIETNPDEQEPIDTPESLYDLSKMSVALHQVETSKENALYNLMLLVQQSLGKGFLNKNNMKQKATSVKTLINLLEIKLNDVLHPEGNALINALPITKMSEIENQILRAWLPQQPKFITFCYNLVGHRIRLRSKYDKSSDFDEADVLLYKPSLNAHVVNIFLPDETCEKTMLNLMLFDYEIIAQVSKKELEVASEVYEKPTPSLVSHSKYNPGDTVYVWFSGQSTFRELCSNPESNFTADTETPNKVSNFYKPDWYSAEITEVCEVDDNYEYTIQYLEPNFKKDSLIRQKSEVKLKAESLALSKFSEFSNEETARVSCIERGFLITTGFNGLVLKLSEVEKKTYPVNTKTTSIFEAKVVENRLFTEEKVYKSREQQSFSVYLKLKPTTQQPPASSKTELSLNQRVKARWGSRSKYYNGFISRVNLDGTYDVSYDDGDTERQVTSDLIIDFYSKPVPHLTNLASFSKVFPNNIRKKLFDVLREKDAVLSVQSKYTFMTRGFKDEVEFEACFAQSLVQKGQGLFAKHQTFEQATILASRVRQLSSVDFGLSFEIQPVVEYEPNADINPAATEEINNTFIKQWSSKPSNESEKKRAKLLKQCQTETNFDFIVPKDRVQVLVEVETEETGKENLWLPATVLLNDKELLTVVLDNGTVVDGLSPSQVKTQQDIKSKISFQSSERSKALSPTKQVASPIGRRRKQKISGEEWAQATQSLMPTRTTLFPEAGNVLSDSNLEVVFSEGMAAEDHLLEQEQVLPKASNKLGTTALTRKFAAFGESLSYKHISAKLNSEVDPAERPKKTEPETNNFNLSIPTAQVYFWLKIEGELKRYKASNFSDMSVQKFCALTKDSSNIYFSVEVQENETEEEKFISSEQVDVSYAFNELNLLDWLKKHLMLQSMENKSLKGTYETSLPWKNIVLNDLIKTALSDALSVTTVDFPLWPKFMAQSYSFLIQQKVRENLIRFFDLGTSRTVAYLQDRTTGYMTKKKKLVQATLELSTLFTGANPDILKYEQLQSRCEKLDVDIKQMESENFIGKLNEDLVKVSRESLLDDAFSVIEKHRNSRSRMIVQFVGENSSGDGVTNDFYTSIAVDLQKRSINNAIPLFIDLKVNEESKDISFATEGLFIQPLAPCGGTNDYKEGRTRNKSIIERFYFLGLLFGKAFLDGHRIPLPLSTEFFEALIEYHEDSLNFSFKEAVIDKIEGAEQHDEGDSKSGVIRTLMSLHEQKKIKELESLLSDLSLVFVDISQPFFPKSKPNKETDTLNKTNESKEEEPNKPDLPEISILSTEQQQLDEFATKASSQGCSQDDIEKKLLEIGATKVQTWKALGVSQHIRNKLAMAKAVSNIATHVVVGEFEQEGTTKTVNVDNLGEYLTYIKNWWLRDGVKPQIESFLKGLRVIVHDEALNGLMKSFSGVELKHLFCGTEDIVWDEKEALLGFLVPSGDYNAKSKPVVQLISILKEMSTKERSLFLNFATAQPRVPTSGLPKIKIYPPLMERTLGIQLGFAVSALTSDTELRALETAVKPFIPGLFQEGDTVQVKTTGSVTSAVVQSWNPKDKKIVFKGEPKGWFQTGQLLRMNTEFANVLKTLKAEIAIKKVIELPAVVQCKPYLRPKATTCAKTIYLPDGYRDEEHMLSIFREAFEDARLGGIHD